MPTRNVSLTDELDKYIEKSVKSGQYANASDVIRAALRTLRQSEKEDRARVEALRTAIQEGFDSGIAEGDVWDRIRRRIDARADAAERRA
jgi:antitoxin ParD1/3/4